MESFIPQWTMHMSKLQTFVDKHEEHEETMEEVQRQRHEENAERLQDIANQISSKTLITGIMSLIWTIAGVAVAVLAIWLTAKLANHSLDTPLHLFSHNPIVQADSAIPKVR